ncbi:Myosin-IIIa [Porphyridium purpureum]|uniref:Myosin-IIIa n=1 Tax=Porphyridium purpureum TaxID=35688 RepID=A0A5J4YYQ4_PORPP|nr:Myosin-IIIa [Porphyridium purpureum]|eukprot:POR6080..scf209_3
MLPVNCDHTRNAELELRALGDCWYGTGLVGESSGSPAGADSGVSPSSGASPLQPAQAAVRPDGSRGRKKVTLASVVETMEDGVPTLTAVNDGTQKHAPTDGAERARPAPDAPKQCCMLKVVSLDSPTTASRAAYLVTLSYEKLERTLFYRALSWKEAGIVPCVVRERKDEICLQFPWMLRGSIHDLLSVLVERRFVEAIIAYIIRGALDVLCHLHAAGYAHGRIKTSNVFYEPDSDQGIFLQDAMIYHLLAPALGPRRRESATTLLGFTAPELLAARSDLWEQPQSTGLWSQLACADIYSLGLLCIELAGGEEHTAMYKDATSSKHCSADTLRRLRAHDQPRFRDGWLWSLKLIDFTTRCMRLSPSSRPTAVQLLQHPWLQQQDLLSAGKDALHQLYLSVPAGLLGRVQSENSDLVQVWSSLERVNRLGVPLPVPVLPVLSLETPLLLNSSQRSGVEDILKESAALYRHCMENEPLSPESIREARDFHSIFSALLRPLPAKPTDGPARPGAAKSSQSTGTAPGAPRNEAET